MFTGLEIGLISICITLLFLLVFGTMILIFEVNKSIETKNELDELTKQNEVLGIYLDNLRSQVNDLKAYKEACTKLALYVNDKVQTANSMPMQQAYLITIHKLDEFIYEEKTKEQ